MDITKIPADSRLVFICEKQSQAWNYANAWLSVRPDIPAHFVALNHLKGAQTVIPRSIPYSSLPRFEEPVWARLDERPLVWTHDRITSKMVRVEEPVCDVLLAADHIVCACDSDLRGAGMFMRFMQVNLGVDIRTREYPVVFTGAEDISSLQEALSRTISSRSPEFSRVLDAAEAKQFFDHNWALNALPLFGDVLRHIGAPGDGFISKFQLLVLHIMSRRTMCGHGELLWLMTKWEGTGKWKLDERCGIGSATSRDKIVESLVDKGLLIKGNNNDVFSSVSPLDLDHISITPRGTEFLSCLHPDTYDPDIGVRIALWGETWPHSRPAMERYIRTYFGKQKRFFAKFRSR